MSGWSPRLVAAARAGAGLLLAFAAGCGRPAAPAVESVLRVSQRNEPASLDPATTTLPDEFGLLRALLEGLLVPGPAGSSRADSGDAEAPPGRAIRRDRG